MKSNNIKLSAFLTLFSFLSLNVSVYAQEGEIQQRTEPVGVGFSVQQLQQQVQNSNAVITQPVESEVINTEALAAAAAQQAADDAAALAPQALDDPSAQQTLDDAAAQQAADDAAVAASANASLQSNNANNSSTSSLVQITPPPAQSLDEGQSVDISIPIVPGSSSDFSVTDYNIHVEGFPDGLVWNSATQSLTGSVSYDATSGDSVRIFTVGITATNQHDPLDNSFAFFVLRIHDVDISATIALPSEANRTISEGKKIHISVPITCPTLICDISEYEIEVNGLPFKELVWNPATQTITGEIPKTTNGDYPYTHEVTINVTGPDGSISTETFELKVVMTPPEDFTDSACPGALKCNKIFREIYERVVDGNTVTMERILWQEKWQVETKNGVARKTGLKLQNSYDSHDRISTRSMENWDGSGQYAEFPGIETQSYTYQRTATSYPGEFIGLNYTGRIFENTVTMHEIRDLTPQQSSGPGLTIAAIKPLLKKQWSRNYRSQLPGGSLDTDATQATSTVYETTGSRLPKTRTLTYNVTNFSVHQNYVFNDPDGTNLYQHAGYYGGDNYKYEQRIEYDNSTSPIRSNSYTSFLKTHREAPANATPYTLTDIDVWRHVETNSQGQRVGTVGGEFPSDDPSRFHLYMTAYGMFMEDVMHNLSILFPQ
jgi:hypothetical protein